MKVTLEKNYRRLYTLAELDMAKAVIAAEKEDEMSAKDWAEYAIKEALRNEEGSFKEILKAEATTSVKPSTDAWNAYGDGTEDMDVWIEATAELYDGIIKVGAYLSDIWGCTEYKHRMNIRRAYWND